MGERLPIIYVRGFGGGQSGIDKLVDDPFYGFNEGSTHIRVGPHGKPRFYQFEGPMLRLMLEDGYKLRVGGSQQQELLNAEPNTLQADCVWVYRFYDEAAGTFGREPEPYEIGKAAEGLVNFIGLVREKTAGHPRVNLVAHSMGGLICRTALQREMKEPSTIVSKLCTIGTPHGGIDPALGGDVGDWFIKNVGLHGSDIFAPDRMREYMVPKGYDPDGAGSDGDGWDPRVMLGAFPVDRILSVVGTNARDYDAARGLSSAAMGEQSDGLVAIRNAYVKASARAYVHRSHSGRYGLVNSEEVYQNLKRFLLGSLRVAIDLDGLDRERMRSRVWQADARLAIRELPVLIHEQSTEHHCPVDLNAQARDQATAMAPVPLITMFLAPDPAKDRCRYALTLRVSSLEVDQGWFWFRDHLEQIADWEDSLIVDLEVSDDGLVTGGAFGWNSNIAGRVASAKTLPGKIAWEGSANGSWQGSVEMPPAAREMLGGEARLNFAATPWD